jgi:hypothetical protein
MRIDALPPANQIEGAPEIRQAAEKYEAAQQRLKERQKAVRDLEDGREKAEWLDAQAADDAIAAGKPTPKRRHVADHEKKIDDLAHEVKVAQLAVQRAKGDLQAVVDEHGEKWLDGLTLGAEKLDQAFDAAAAALASLHGQRMALNALRAKLGADVPNVRFVRLKPSQLIDSLSGDKLAVAYNPDGAARQRQRVVIHAADVIAALSSLGVVEEPPQVVGSGLGGALKQSFRHASAVGRNFLDEEGEKQRAKEAVTTGRELLFNERPASVYVPSDEGDD